MTKDTIWHKEQLRMSQMINTNQANDHAAQVASMDSVIEGNKSTMKMLNGELQQAMDVNQQIFAFCKQLGMGEAELNEIHKMIIGGGKTNV